MTNLEISAQAFWKIGSSSQAYLVTHVLRPQFGRHGFAQWLLPPPGPGKAPVIPMGLSTSGSGGKVVKSTLKPAGLPPASKTFGRSLSFLGRWV